MTSQNRVLRALWVGGPPGKTLDNISRNLYREGIEIAERWDSVVEVMRSKHRIPDPIDVVLLNYEMCSHGLQDKIKLLAKKANKPFVLASLGSRKTILELRSKGILPEKTEIQKATKMKREPPMDLVQKIVALIDERNLLFVQRKGIEQRLEEIERNLNQIRREINLYNEVDSE